MPDPRAVVAALRLGPLATVRLAGWKAWQAAVRSRDVRTDSVAYVDAGARFATAWEREWGEQRIGSWLARPGGGHFFIDPAEAAAWCRNTCTANDLSLAESSASGVFDLLASGPQDLGKPPRWRTDLYSGLAWPLEEAHRLSITRGDGSDVRTVWELSRAYHFIALARAYHKSGEARFARAFVEHVDSWIEQNPLGHGPHWASPMDAAIRGANWTLALVLFADGPQLDSSFVARMLSNLYATALHVERHREWHPVYRGNHYAANGVGLAYLGALFRGDRRGERWLRRGTRIIADELLRQVHADGVSFEASIGYHRLATQLFGWGAELVRRNALERWTAAHEARLAAMFDFIDAYTPVSGLAPLIGDNDDGQLHVMDARMLREPRRHHLGLPPRPSSGKADGPVESQLYRQGGFAILREAEDHCILRCGAVGLLGAGSHDHNDQLSFELVIGGQRVVRDSGTYCYTRDLAQRYAFRSTAAHNAVQVEGEEQNPIRVSAPWRVLEDRTQARVLHFHVTAGCATTTAEHLGFSHLRGAPTIRRTLQSRPHEGWLVIDEICSTQSDADHHISWRLHVDTEAELLEHRDGRAAVRLGPVIAAVEYPDKLAFSISSRLSSDRYGEQVARPVLQLTGVLRLPALIRTRFMRTGASHT